MMIKAARKHKRHVQMGTQRRSTQQFIDAIQQIHDGAIGRVYLAQAWYTNNRPSIGRGKSAEVPKDLDYDLWQGPAPRRPYRIHQPNNHIHYNWHSFWHWGNGELGNNGVHSLDLCRWGLQVDYPTRVTSSGGRYCYPDDDQETPDTNFVAFEFGDNKSATWEGLSCSRLQHARGDLQGTMVHFHGDSGNLAIGDWGYVVYDHKGKEIRSAGDQSKRADYPSFVSGHAKNFIGAIRETEKLSAEIEEGHKSTMLCHLGNIAYRVGRSIRCRPQDGQIIDDAQASRFWTREYEPGWEPNV
jgi:predicted dehydrogenase